MCDRNCFSCIYEDCVNNEFTEDDMEKLNEAEILAGIVSDKELYEKDRYSRHREKQLAYHKDYYKRNRERLKEKRRQYYRKNREACLAAQKDYYQRKKRQTENKRYNGHYI